MPSNINVSDIVGLLLTVAMGLYLLYFLITQVAFCFLSLIGVPTAIDPLALAALQKAGVDRPTWHHWMCLIGVGMLLLALVARSRNIKLQSRTLLLFGYLLIGLSALSSMRLGEFGFESRSLWCPRCW